MSQNTVETLCPRMQVLAQPVYMFFTVADNPYWGAIPTEYGATIFNPPFHL